MLEMEVGRGPGSSFTVNGHFFAVLSVDGRLRIWDTASGKLIQEFSPSLHVESSCTCLCWTREESRGKSKKEPKTKKRKVDKDQEPVKEVYPALVIGTKKGELIIYDPVSGELEGCFTGGHTNTVNDIQYLDNNGTLYSCSDDKHITEWSYDNKEVKSTWKADKIAVNRICLGPSENTLLSSGRAIKLWNLETKELLQRFHGHKSSISLLQFSPYCSSLTKTKSLDEGYYFLSGSCEDRIINAWHINFSRPDKTAIASFMLSDVPAFMDSMLISKDDKSVKLCVGCKDGRINFFETILNGKSARPIESSKMLTVLEKEGKKSNVTPASFLNARLYDENGVSLMLISGVSLRPVFQKIIYSDLEVNSKIIRAVSKHLFLNESMKDANSTSELAKQNTRTKVVGNAMFVPITSKGTHSVTQLRLDMNGNEQDRSKTETTEDTLSMEERLKSSKPEQDFVVKMKPSGSTPNAGSFSQMLIQGLHSSDGVLVNDILFKSYSDSVLRNTIRRIPNNLVGHLLSIVVDKLHRNPARSKDLSAWLRTIMAVHLTYLMTNKDLTGTLSNLYRLLKAQQGVHPQLLNLQGKIDLLFSHATNIKANSSGDDEDVGTAVVVFNDDSEDETEEMFGKLIESEEEDEIEPDAKMNVDDEDESEEEEDGDNDNEEDSETDDNNDESENESD